MRLTWQLVWLAILALLAGCSLSSVTRIDQLADRFGFERKVIRGSGYAHVAWLARMDRREDILHVYLEGDGLPWVTRHIVASEPTSRNPLMLRLMSLDGMPSVYLGRPCYNGLAGEAGCDVSLWTSRRYSREVVDSMAEALGQIITAGGFGSIWLFGHSGGGTLAMLLAERFTQTRGVVTLAGNLDTRAWTEHHDYAPLHGSLDPASREPLGASVYQMHLVAENDVVVPPGLVTGWISRQGNSERCVFKNFDHHCCWSRIWPDLLQGGIASRRCPDDPH